MVVSTSCSLLHTAVDLQNETTLDAELKSWLAFAAQKVIEVVALAHALDGKKDEVRKLPALCFVTVFFVSQANICCSGFLCGQRVCSSLKKIIS